MGQSTSSFQPPQPVPVVITGGTGFIGTVLIRRLLSVGFTEIRTVSRTAQLPEDLAGRPEIRVFQGDLQDKPLLRRAFEGCSAVFHVAAKAGVWGRDEDYRKTNIEGTGNALNAAREGGVRWFIHTSTPSVVFNGGPFRGEDENLPYGDRFLCAYARTKAEAEATVLKNNGVGGMETLALRPHLVWGPGDPHILPRLIAKARQGRLRQIGNGQNKVDITYVDNAALAHVAALSALQSGRGAAGQAFFISQGEPVNLWDWLRDLLGRLELRLPGPAIPLPLAYAVGGCCELAFRLLPARPEPPMTRFVAVELAKDHYFSTDRARTILGYTPEVSIEEGLQRTVHSIVTRS